MRGRAVKACGCVVVWTGGKSGKTEIVARVALRFSFYLIVFLPFRMTNIHFLLDGG